VPDLLETLVRELESPRAVSAQVARHLAANYSIADDEIGQFLVETLPTLEEDEIDLILSPLFTPKLADQAVFALELGRGSVPADEQTLLVARALARPTDGQLVTGDERTHRIRLAEVTIERYVYRLRLEGTIPAPIFDLIQGFPSADRAMLQAVGRRAIWEKEGRYGILERYLTATAGLDAWGPDAAESLLDLLERYKPANIVDLVAAIPRWREGLRGDLGAASAGRPFFSERIERSHGGERDHRSPENTLIEAKREELAFLARLEPLLVG
jgi:hypothetical protein